MPISDLTQLDFDFWVDYNRKDIACHDKEFMEAIDPEMQRAHYRGYKTKQYSDFMNDPIQLAEQSLVITKVFTSGNTILPQLFNQQPKKIAIPTEGTGPLPAALMTASLNHNDRMTRQKMENQNAVMNAYWFGIGWKKLGYQMVFFGDENQPEMVIDPEEKAQSQQSDAVEMTHSPRPVRHEGLINSSESPLNVLVDHKGTIWKYKVITHRLKKSLHELRQNPRYDKKNLDELLDKLKYQRGTRFDERDIILDLNEKMFEFENGVWILSFVDQLNKPLRYDKALNKGRIPWEPLVFTNEPDVRYPVSHMNVQGRVQNKINAIATLMYEIISRSRNQLGVFDEALSKGQKQSLMKNLIGGIIRFNRPITDSVIREISSKPVTADMTSLLMLLMNNATEVGGATEQRLTGRSQNDTLGQDQIAEMGATMRESGMLDREREWMINQMEHEGGILQQFSNSKPLRLMLTKKDFYDPDSGKIIKDGPLEFMTERNPMPLSKFLRGSFQYEVNIYEAVKPNPRALAREYDEFILAYSNPIVNNALLEMNKRIRLDLVAEARAHQFQLIQGQQFIEDLSPRQVAAIKVGRILESRGGQVPPSLTTERENAQESSAQRIAEKTAGQTAEVQVA